MLPVAALKSQARLLFFWLSQLITTSSLLTLYTLTTSLTTFWQWLIRLNESLETLRWLESNRCVGTLGWIAHITAWAMAIEDGLWIGHHLKAWNGLQRVRTIPGVWPGPVRTPRSLWGQTEFQSTWVCVAAWCWARRQVCFLAAA